jgi:hypothetical protein
MSLSRRSSQWPKAARFPCRACAAEDRKETANRRRSSHEFRPHASDAGFADCVVQRLAFGQERARLSHQHQAVLHRDTEKTDQVDERRDIPRCSREQKSQNASDKRHRNRGENHCRFRGRTKRQTEQEKYREQSQANGWLRSRSEQLAPGLVKIPIQEVRRTWINKPLRATRTSVLPRLMIPKRVMDECRERAQVVIEQGRPMNRTVAVVIVVFWMSVLAAMIWFVVWSLRKDRRFSK